MTKAKFSAGWICISAALAILRSSPVSAQVVPQGGSYRSIEMLPDWTGVWQPVTWMKHAIGHGRAPYRDLHIPFKPDAEAKFLRYQKIAFGSGNFPSRIDHCANFGFPGDMDHPGSTTQFLFTPGQVTLASTDWLRRIYTDGRKHSDDLLTFEGDSIGHWEADGTLVIDTAGLDPGDEFILGFAQGNDSHGEERIHKTATDTIVDDVTFEAPDILTKPYKYQIIYKKINYPITEFDCAQNNRDVNPVTGAKDFVLTPPPE